MKTDEAIALVREILAPEPLISRVEASFLTIRDETNGIDLHVYFDGERMAAHRKIVPLLIDYMERVADVPVEFMTLPSCDVDAKSSLVTVYSRD